MGACWAAENMVESVADKVPEDVLETAYAASTAMGTGDYVWTLASFVFFTGLVAVVTWLLTRKEKLDSEDGFFLAGRNLVFPVIAGSLLLTNLSTEQLVGLNADAFQFGLHVMAWEVTSVFALVAMALFFLPRFLKSGITTVPEMLEIRYGGPTRTICNLIFLVAYTTILLPIVLYTGAQGLISILNLHELTGIENTKVLLWVVIAFVGLVGSIYALFGGMRSVAVSDTLNGIILLTGGFLITYYGLYHLSGGEGWIAGLGKLSELNEAGRAAGDINRLNSIGGANGQPPFGTLFTGVLIINLFYWCTNQQIIQRTLAARSLSEGQKGVLLTGLLKLFGPLYLVLPGILAFYLYKEGAFGTLPATDLTEAGTLQPNLAYGTLVRNVLPVWLTGFFAAAMVGAILSSFNSALNSTCTLFSLGLYKPHINPKASEAKVVSSGVWFGWVVAAVSVCIAPILDSQPSIFKYLQTMNTIYFIPIFSVVLVGFLSRRVPATPANVALVGGAVTLLLYYFWWKPEPSAVLAINDFHVAAIVFAALVLMMVVWGKIAPRPTAWIHEESGRVKHMTPWKWAVPASVVLIVLIVLIYGWFADFSVL